jgi:D-aspartate ligase
MPADPPQNHVSFGGLAQVLARRTNSRSAGPPAVIASAFQTGLNLMRDLEQKGVRTIAIDCNPTNPGFRSRYGCSFLCPNPDHEPERWLAYMLSLATAIGEKSVLIAASDIFVSAIGRFAQILQQHFIFSETGSTLQASLGTKETQYALARKYGLPSPQSAYIQSSDELDQFSRQARYPVMLKPRQAREWQALPEGNPFRNCKTVSAASSEELLANYSQVSHLVPSAVVQEEIVGPDSAKYCYLSVYSTRGQRLGSCVVQELRAYPLLYGCATLVQPVIDEEIDKVCNNFLLSIGYIGICEIELKRDSRDGQVLLIEVNPRFSGTGDAAKYAGVETGYMHYLDLIDRSPEPAVATNFNFRHIMLVADFSAFPRYLEQGQIGWKDWINSLRGRIRYFDLDISDLSNARITITRAARALLGGLWHTRRHK